MADVKVYCRKCGRLLQSWTGPGDSYLPRVADCVDYGQKHQTRDPKQPIGKLVKGKVTWQES